MVEAGTFRRDFYYRINVIELDLPALRERPEDILPLVRHFISQLALLHDKAVEGFTPEALRVLMNHDFPGNIRELENIVEHGFVLTRSPLIDVEHLPGWLVESNEEVVLTDLDDCERRVILSALERNGGSRVSAAEELGIHKSTLYRKMRRLGLLPSGTAGKSARQPSET